ncbi:MAG: Xaa-Pro peptidase family protein [Nitrolancea sp.]
MRGPNETLRGKYTDIDRIRQTIDNGPYDAIIVTSPENTPYYSGFWNYDLRGIPERAHFVVWPRGGEPVWVVFERRLRNLKPEETFLTEVVPYEGEGTDSMRAVAEVLHSMSAEQGRVGIEGRNFSSGQLIDLQQRLPQAKFEDAQKFLESVRLIKTPAEVELLTRMARWTAESIDTAFGDAKPGDTERQVAARMQYELLLRGADLIAFPVFGAGERSGAFHTIASDHVLQSGMVLKTDFGGFRDGYFSDLARTVVIGRASDRQRDLHAKVTEIKHRIVDAIQPGMLASEAAGVGQHAYESLGLEYKGNVLGHSVGLGIHESPQIYPWVEEPILPGMVMMIEVGTTDVSGDSFHVEDMILINDRGAAYAEGIPQHGTLWEVGA